MNTAIWTLWLLTRGLVITQGGRGPDTVTPLATFASQKECISAAYTTDKTIQEMYAPKPTDDHINIGTFFCVPGTPVKR